MRILIMLLLFSISVLAQNSSRDIINPYEHVNWDTFEHHKGNLHTHTTESDGDFSVADVIDMYHNAGYTILSITDHDAIGQMVLESITWPWTDFGRDPQELGMLAIRGHELSLGPHIGSYFNEYPGLTNSVQTNMDEIESRNGIAIMCHPGRNRVFTIERYESYYNSFNSFVGMEVVTQLDPYPGDRDLWDDKLSVLMPDRPLWGFASDDMHFLEHFNTNWTTFVVPDLTKENVRSAMENGVLFASSRVTIDDATGDPPVVSKVLHNRETGVVTIEAEGYDNISWVSMANEVATGESINYRETENIEKYFRATLTGAGGQTFVQPFAVYEDGVSVKEVENRFLNMRLSVYPNPFNPVSTIYYSIAQNAHVTIDVYDIKGSVVSRLKEGAVVSGSHSVMFDAGNLSSGVYFVRFSANNHVKQQKVLLVK